MTLTSGIVIPAQAGIQWNKITFVLDSRLRGNDGVSGFSVVRSLFV